MEGDMHVTEPSIFTTRYLGGVVADDYGTADDRPPIVLLHGMTFDRTIWRPLVERLQQIDPGRRVLNIDLPGHGESPEQPSYDLGVLPAQLHLTLEQAGIAAPVMAGHSAGAMAATMYAGQFPVSGVVNVDQPLQIDAFAAFVRSLKDRLEGQDFAATWRLFYDSFHTERLPPGAQDLVSSTCRPRQQVVTGYWRPILDGHAAEIAAGVDRTLAVMRSADVPYLHIAGEDLDPAYCQWFTERMPNVIFDVWPGSGHFPQLARPEQFAQLMAGTSEWRR
jgi:pimeloyl-ACP methyl ester carboxylesterase